MTKIMLRPLFQSNACVVFIKFSLCALAPYILESHYYVDCGWLTLEILPKMIYTGKGVPFSGHRYLKGFFGKLR